VERLARVVLRREYEVDHSFFGLRDADLESLPPWTNRGEHCGTDFRCQENSIRGFY
jgi:hypothetical protein